MVYLHIAYNCYQSQRKKHLAWHARINKVSFESARHVHMLTHMMHTYTYKHAYRCIHKHRHVHHTRPSHAGEAEHSDAAVVPACKRSCILLLLLLLLVSARVHEDECEGNSQALIEHAYDVRLVSVIQS